MDHFTPPHAFDFLKKDPTAVFVDCRSEMEFLFVGHRVGAMMIPWNDGPDWDINPHFVGQEKGGRTFDPTVGGAGMPSGLPWEQV